MTRKIYTAAEPVYTTSKSSIQQMPVLEEVRRFWGSVYFRFSRVNMATLKTETLRGFLQCDESVFQSLLSIKGQQCKLEGMRADGQEFTWK